MSTTSCAIFSLLFIAPISLATRSGRGNVVSSHGNGGVMLAAAVAGIVPTTFKSAKSICTIDNKQLLLSWLLEKNVLKYIFLRNFGEQARRWNAYPNRSPAVRTATLEPKAGVYIDAIGCMWWVRVTPLHISVCSLTAAAAPPPPLLQPQPHQPPTF